MILALLVVSIIINLILLYLWFVNNMTVRGLAYYIGYNFGHESMPTNEEIDAYMRKATTDFINITSL